MSSLRSTLRVFAFALLMGSAYACENAGPPPAAPTPHQIIQPTLRLAEDPLDGRWRELATYPLAAAPATHYHAPATPDAAQRGLGLDLWHTLPQLQASACLSAAAARYAAYHPAKPLRDPPRALLTALLHHCGCPDATAAVRLLFTTRATPDDFANFLTNHQASFAAYTHAGLGSAPGDGDPFEWTWVLLLTQRNATLDPFPRAPQPGTSVPLRFSLMPPLEAAEVLLMPPDEEIINVPFTTRGNQIAATVPIGANPGVYTLQVLATGPDGPQIAFHFPLYVGRPLPTTWEGFLPLSEEWLHDAAAAEAHMFNLLQRDRTAHGLPLLQYAPELATIARNHSLDMQRHAFFAHNSPNTGSLAQRLERAGLHLRFAAENIARNGSIAEAQENLMESLGHRANILSPHATHVGIGITIVDDGPGKRTYHATQVFARILPRPGFAEILATLAAQPVAPTPREELHGVAQRLAQLIHADGFDGDKVNTHARFLLDAMRTPYRRFTVHSQILLALEDLQIPAALGTVAKAQLGLGLLTPDDPNQPARVVVFIVEP